MRENKSETALEVSVTAMTEASRILAAFSTFQD